MSYRRRKESNAVEQQIVDAYQYSHSGYEVARRLNLPSHQVYYYLKKSGIKLRSLNECARLYHGNFGYFSFIDSHEKAQILGFIAADGCVYQKKASKVLSIALNDNDYDYLDYIRARLGYNGPIERGINTQGQSFARLSIHSHQLCNDLFKLGVTQRKSLTLQFPTLDQVSAAFIPSFICGYLEGDGCIHFRHQKVTLSAEISFCVTKEFGESLEKIINGMGLTCTWHRKKSQCERDINSYSLRINGNQQALKFLSWMYASVPFKMTRKYDQYLKLLSLYDSDGNLIYTPEMKEQRRSRYAASMALKKVEMAV